jgi:hypothetical protein
MTWGDSANIDTTNMDAGTDSPAQARSNLKAIADELTNVIDGLGTAEGPASLDANSRVNITQLMIEFGTSFPAVTTHPYGYRVFRTDLGEWFTLMDATVWGGSGNAWVGDRVETVGGGREISTTTSPVDMHGWGGVDKMDSDRGFYLANDMLITGAVFSMDKNQAGTDITFKIYRGASAVVTLTTDDDYFLALPSAVASWEPVDSGDVLWAQLEIDDANTVADPMFRVCLQRVIAAT